jgi:hypothetical protein
MRFDPPLRTHGLAELKDLYRTRTVEEYQCQSSFLLCRCEDLTPLQQVKMFIAGLDEHCVPMSNFKPRPTYRRS